MTTPAHGTAVINAGSQIDYTPDDGYHGPNSFDYTIEGTTQPAPTMRR